MKRLAWILVAVCLSAFQIWGIIFSPSGPINFDNHPVLLGCMIAAYAGSGLGGVWMLFAIIRYERRIFPVILIALFIPNAFLWYYFERIRPRKRIAREQHAT